MADWNKRVEHNFEIERARDEFRTRPTDYERTAHEFKRLLSSGYERIDEFKTPCPVHPWPKWTAFMALALTAVFVFLMLHGCTAPLVQTGENCSYVSAKGVLISRPCALKDK